MKKVGDIKNIKNTASDDINKVGNVKHIKTIKSDDKKRLEIRYILKSWRQRR